MENLKRLQNLVLKLIIFLVWFDVMCFVLILAGQVFHWSFFNDAISGAFFTCFGLSIGALVALALLHVVVTLSIISNSISLLAKEKNVLDETITSKSKNNFKNLIIASVVGIILIAGYQGILERNAVTHKAKKIESNLKDTAQSTLATKMGNLIDKDESINKLYSLRDEMLLSLEDDRGIILLIPKMGEQNQVFYQITPWNYDRSNEKTIAESLDRLFMPYRGEKSKFKEMLKTHKPFSVVNRYKIRSFYPVVKDGQIQFILLLDTSRNISSDYLMSRSKFKD